VTRYCRRGVPKGRIPIVLATPGHYVAKNILATAISLDVKYLAIWSGAGMRMEGSHEKDYF